MAKRGNDFVLRNYSDEVREAYRDLDISDPEFTFEKVHVRFKELLKKHPKEMCKHLFWAYTSLRDSAHKRGHQISVHLNWSGLGMTEKEYNGPIIPDRLKSFLDAEYPFGTDPREFESKLQEYTDAYKEARKKIKEFRGSNEYIARDLHKLCDETRKKLLTQVFPIIYVTAERNCEGSGCDACNRFIGDSLLPTGLGIQKFDDDAFVGTLKTADYIHAYSDILSLHYPHRDSSRIRTADQEISQIHKTLADFFYDGYWRKLRDALTPSTLRAKHAELSISIGPPSPPIARHTAAGALPPTTSASAATPASGAKPSSSGGLHHN